MMNYPDYNYCLYDEDYNEGYCLRCGEWLDGESQCSECGYDEEAEDESCT
jgi:hypothetical protein